MRTFKNVIYNSSHHSHQCWALCSWSTSVCSPTSCSTSKLGTGWEKMLTIRSHSYWNMHEYDVMVINKNCDMPRNSWLHLGLYVWPGKPEIFEASNPMVSCLMIMMILMITIIIRTQWYWWHPLTDAWWHYGCRGLPRSPSPWSWTHCKWWQCALETNSNLSECWPLIIEIIISYLTLQYLYRKSKVSWALPDRSGWFSGLEIILRWSFLPLLLLLLIIIIIISITTRERVASL